MKGERRWGRRLWRFAVGLLAVVGCVTLLLAGALAGGAWWLMRHFTGEPPLPSAIVLTLDLGEPLSEAASLDPLSALGGTPPLELGELVLALERAAGDPRVMGLVARLDATEHGFAMAQELRGAIQRFAAAGKPTTAWADSFGELGHANEGYYIATAFDSIQLQPGGLVGLAGLAVEIPFIRPLLDRLGIEPEVIRRSEYKTALDSATESGLTPANAEMMNDLLDRLHARLVADLAEGRGMSREAMAALIDRGPFTAEAALEGGLIDALLYRDEVHDQVLEQAGEAAEMVPLADYARSLDDLAAGEPEATMALVVGQGTIQRRSGRFESVLGADALADALAQAREDAAIDAVVLRLDTGGGSAVGSETIAREIALLQAAGKPVVVSMGNAAASGGYWIAMGADRILAQPGTLTGSIGVIAGKPVLAGAWEWLGINWASIERGANAGFLSLNRPFDDLARARLEATIDGLYAQFKAGVAAGRDLAPEEVEAIAKGRVWLGEQALELGLVDELGGLIEARAAALALLDLPPEAEARLKRYPAPPSTVERLLELTDQPWLATLAGTLGWLEATASRGPASASLPRFR